MYTCPTNKHKQRVEEREPLALCAKALLWCSSSHTHNYTHTHTHTHTRTLRQGPLMVELIGYKLQVFFLSDAQNDTGSDWALTFLRQDAAQTKALIGHRSSHLRAPAGTCVDSATQMWKEESTDSRGFNSIFPTLLHTPC